VTDIPDAATHSFEEQEPPITVQPQWMKELITKWGQPRVDVTGQEMTRHGSKCERSLWVWFPGGLNHLLTVDRFPASGPSAHRWRWEISVESHEAEDTQLVTMMVRSDLWPHLLIHRALVAAGWLV
jgi:hypothetical protein